MPQFTSRIPPLFAAAILVVLSALPLAAPRAADINFKPAAVLAMETRKWDELQRLLLTGTDPNTRDVEKQTLLIVAARYNYIRAVEILLENRARPDLVDGFGNTALMWAAGEGNTEVVKKLLDANANVSIQNRQGVNALMRAAKGGYPDIAKLLLTAGADPKRTDYTGRDALSWAQEGRNSATIREIEAAAR